MALHDYTSEILGSKANVRVLKTLLRYKGKIFTIRELAKTARLSHPEVSRVVKEFERRGVVRIQPVGRAQQVSLNEASYIVKSLLEPLFRAEKETINSLISTIKPFFNDKRISSVSIFGSVAAGLERKISDIDLLIITEDKEVASDCSARASDAALSKFGLALSPLIMSQRRFIREHEGDLGKSIMESYAHVTGRDLKELVEIGKVSR